MILYWRKLTNTTSAKWSRVSNIDISHVDSMCSSYNVENDIYFCKFSPKNHNPILITWKTSEKHKLSDILQITDQNSSKLLKSLKTRLFVKVLSLYCCRSTMVPPESKKKSFCPLLNKENAFLPLNSTPPKGEREHKARRNNLLLFFLSVLLFPFAMVWKIEKFDSAWRSILIFCKIFLF